MIKRLPTSFPKALANKRYALHLDELSSEQPLNFQLYYAKNEQKRVVNTIYLEDGNPKLDLYLEILNDSSEKIELKSPSAGSQTAQSGEEEYAHFNRCHFYIQLEKQIQIKLEEISIESKDQWQVNYDEENNFITIYFLHKNGLVLQPSTSLNGSDKVLLKFQNLAANNPTVKTTNVEFVYNSYHPGEIGKLSQPEDIEELDDEELDDEELDETQMAEKWRKKSFPKRLSVKTPISITHHPDKNNILLQWRFIGSNAIINDGTTGNELNLKIFNRSLLNYNRPNVLLDKMNSKFIVSFETGDKSEALTTLDKAKEISITTTDSQNWKINRTQNSAEWTIQLNDTSNKDKLAPGEGIELNIKNLVSSKASGVSYLYITYQNIGDYPDGQLVVPIEKTPLLYRGAQVGIGIKSPSAQLHVGGTIQAKGDNETLIGLVVKPTFDNNQKNNIKPLGLLVHGASATTEIETKEVVRFVRPGVSGVKNSNSIGFKVGSYEPGIKGKTQLDITLSSDPQDSNNWGNVPDVTVMSFLADGKVGIGTKKPKSNLSISNNYKDKTQEAGVLGEITFVGYDDRKYASASIKAESPSWDDRSHLIFMTSSDGTSPKERMRITNNGNIGIGTTNPSAKLEIDGGDIKIASEDKGILFADGAKIYKKSGSGLKIQLGAIQAKHDNETLIGLEVKPTFDNNQKKNVKPLGLLVYGASATTEIETKEVVRLVRPAKDKKNSNSVDFKVGAAEAGEGGKTRLDIALSSDAKDSNNWGNVPDVTVMSLNAGTTSSPNNVDVYGDFHIKGKKPIEYKYYSVDGDNQTIETGYDVKDWIAVVGGVDSVAHTAFMSGLMLIPEERNSKWIIRCDLAGVTDKYWKIIVLFIRKELVSVKT
ncbi:MAG: hypothetical protein U7127_03085 [Phormidium sp.]